MKYIKGLWCSAFHWGGFTIVRDEEDECKWQCKKCGHRTNFW